MELSRKIQSILRLMNELRPARSIEVLEESVAGEMTKYNFSARTKIDKAQAADLFFIEQEFLFDFLRNSEHLISGGNEDVIKSKSLNTFLKKVEKLFRKTVMEFQALWDDPNSSIFSSLPGVAKWMPEIHAPAFNNLSSLITKNARSRAIGGFRPRSVLWALYDYILYALIGKRGKGLFVAGKQTDAPAKWVIDDLRNQSVPENDNYYGYAVLRNIVAPPDMLEMDENTHIRRSSKFEWRELLLPARKSHIKENMLVNEVNFSHLKNLDSLCLLETTLPDSSRSAFRGELTRESMNASLELGKKLRSNLYDAVSCMRLVIHPKIGIAFLNHTGVHIETSPLSPIFRPEYNPPPDIQSGISGTIADRERHYLTFKTRPDENKALIDFWEQFKIFRHEVDKTDFHKYYNRALTRFNQACTEYYIEDAIIDLVISMEIITQGGGPITGYRIAGFVAPDNKIQLVQEIVSNLFDLRHEYIHRSTLKEKEINDRIQILSQGQLISRAFLRNTIYYCINEGIPTGDFGFRAILDRYFIDCEERKKMQDLIPEWSMRDISEIQ